MLILACDLTVAHSSTLSLTLLFVSPTCSNGAQVSLSPSLPPRAAPSIEELFRFTAFCSTMRDCLQDATLPLQRPQDLSGQGYFFRPPGQPGAALLKLMRFHLSVARNQNEMSVMQTFLFLNRKVKSLFHQRKRPAKLAWTVTYRKQHRKVRTWVQQ